MRARGGWAIVAAAATFTARAEAEPRPLTVQYRAHEGCPSEEVLIEEITWRTPLVRVAAPGEEGYEVRARITKRGATSRGQVSVWTGRAWITREIAGPSCAEVVGALGLVTALAIDPRASTGRKAPPPPPPPAPRPLPPPPPRPRFAPIAPELEAPPLPAFPVAWDRPRPWMIGARAAVAIAPAPRPLFGAALFFARTFDEARAASLRVALEIAATGSFDVGPGGASFLRVVGRVDGCAFAIRPWKWLSIVPCLGAEAGALRGAGVASASLPAVDSATVPWVALGLLPLASIHLGAASIEAQGGPLFPLVRRQFNFQRPDFIVHDVPPVTGAVSLGVGIAFP